MQFILDRRKRPIERFRIGIDFTEDLDVTDTIQSQIVTAVDKSGTDVTGALLSGALISGNIVSVVIAAGVDGQTYRVFFKATTVNGLIFQHSVFVQVGLNT